MCNTHLSRRLLLKSAIASGLASVTGCATNEHTGRSQISLVSDATIENMAEPVWREVLASEPRSRNRQRTLRLQQVGQRMAEASGIEADWEFVLFAQPSVNAFVLPGGKVGLYEGLFAVARNDAQLAAVIGHEIGHLQGRHHAERASQSTAISIGANILGAVVADRTGSATTADIASQVFSIGAEGAVQPYSRSNELEADVLSVTNMYRAGYDPNEAIQLWERMIALSGDGGTTYSASHPAPLNRIEEIREAIKAL